MDDEKQEPLWVDESDVPDIPLRRPNLPSHTNINNANLIEEPHQSINIADSLSTPTSTSKSSKSTLSANAKEWYPVGYKKTSAQNRLLKFKQNQQTSQTNSDSSESNNISSHETMDYSNLDVCTHIQSYINTLIEDPGQFDYILDSFVETLTPYYSDIDVIGNVAKLIFSEAIAESNFRYSAARLCRILEEQCPLFRSALMLFAGSLITDFPLTCGTNLALTLAELFAQTKCDNLYGKYVIQSIDKLISMQNIENIKCVCQVLKLAGAALDTHYKTKLNSIIALLEQLKPVLPTLVNLIDDVRELRDSHWGQDEVKNDSSESRSVRYIVGATVHGTRFYAPDGMELSEEEKQFLAENCADLFGEDMFDDSDPDELFDPDNEMDAEVHAAFREFTKSNKN